MLYLDEAKMTWKRIGRKRLSVDIPNELHAHIQKYAAMRGITITKWVLRACYTRKKLESDLLKDEHDRKTR
jgi:hypothetical protein